MVFQPTLLAAVAAWLLALGSDDAPALYARSLRLHLASWSIDTVRVLRAEDIKLPARIGKLVVVQHASPLALLNGKRSEGMVKILPLQASKGELVVVLIDYVVSKAGKEVLLEWESSETFRYRYAPAKQSYQLVGREKGTL